MVVPADFAEIIEIISPLTSSEVEEDFGVVKTSTSIGRQLRKALAAYQVWHHPNYRINKYYSPVNMRCVTMLLFVVG